MTMMMFPSGLLHLMETMDMVDLDSCLQTSLITTPHTSLSQNPDEDDDDEIYYDEVCVVCLSVTKNGHFLKLPPQPPWSVGTTGDTPKIITSSKIEQQYLI